MQNFSRILRHLGTTRAAARKAFPAVTLSAIQAAIGDGEEQHRAQLRLIIEPALDWSDLVNRTTSRGRAHALFSRYRIWDTEENCGVLVYINLAERSVEIIADRSVGRAVHRTQWEAVCKTMTQGFAQGRFHDSALAGVMHLNGLLATHFPAGDGSGRGNELSDRPVIL